MEQQIRFCASADGTRIAYGTVGEGERAPLVYVWSWGGALEADFDLPEVRACLEGLARGRLFVKFDRRDVGASQREVADLSLEAHVADLRAVVDHLGLKCFDLMGAVDGSVVAVTYAAQHPERVRRMVLRGAYAFGGDCRVGVVRNIVNLIRNDWSLGRRMLAGAAFPNGPVEAQRWFSRMLLESISPDTLARYLKYEIALDVRHLLSQVQAPTLVLHRRRNQVIPVSAAQSVAASIPNARFVLLDGDILHAGFDSAEFLRLQRDFLDEGRPAPGEPALPSSFRTILFTDLVGHSQMMSRLGDERGRTVLREHERITREVLKAHGGTEVKTTGDGFMASFGSVTRAVECAIALQRAFAQRDVGAHHDAPLRIRVGLNAGAPIEEEGPDGRSDLFGATVILASRIAVKAEGGEILVADTVRGLCSGKGFLFAGRGEFVAKGFEEPVRLFEVRWRE